MDHVIFDLSNFKKSNNDSGNEMKKSKINSYFDLYILHYEFDYTDYRFYLIFYLIYIAHLNMHTRKWEDKCPTSQKLLNVCPLGQFTLLVLGLGAGGGY